MKIRTIKNWRITTQGNVIYVRRNFKAVMASINPDRIAEKMLRSKA